MTMQQPATQASFARELPSTSSTNPQAVAPRLDVVRRVDRWLRERSLLLLAIAMVAAFSWPEFASRILARSSIVHVPLTGVAYDSRTLALAVIVLSASLRCTPRDFTRVFRSKAGYANLFAVYLFVPALTLGIGYAALHFGHEALRGVALGLILSVIVPVAMTSAVWTRASQGSVPLALGTLAVTSLIAVFLTPFVLSHLAGVPGVKMGASLTNIRVQVVLAFAVPLVLGSTLRGLGPKLANAIEPLFSIGSMLALLAFVSDSASALRPHLSTHRSVLVIAVVLTVLTNALSYGIGFLVAKSRKLDEADTIAVVFGSGMRSVPAALVIGAIAFPAVPLVGLPPILWSVTQQLLAGVITRRFIRQRDLNEPVLPLNRRIADPGAERGVAGAAAEPKAKAKAKRRSRPSLSELAESIEGSIVTPLREIEDTLVYRPAKNSAPSIPG
jgi:predicted Na+-dependent transporter